MFGRKLLSFNCVKYIPKLKSNIEKYMFFFGKHENRTR